MMNQFIASLAVFREMRLMLLAAPRSLDLLHDSGCTDQLLADHVTVGRVRVIRLSLTGFGVRCS